ncbi:hypothetical protein SUGI_0603100 [Cryptomeria japonica]|nr:hypothetical protein SUGI_0603100 [Cryptomeria japonica]
MRVQIHSIILRSTKRILIVDRPAQFAASHKERLRRNRRYSKGKKTLECILTSDIDKVGTAGETVKVAPGYFRNHLMPKSLALPNLNKYAQLIAEQNKIYQRPKEEKKVEVVQRSEEQQMDEFKTAVRRLSNGRLGLRRLVLNYGKELRYPVTKEEILDEVRRQLQVSLEKENLIMPENLTMCGEYELPLRLPKSQSFILD